ncbi:MAG: amidohydrolase family protein [Planctomycetota bacterium]
MRIDVHGHIGLAAAGAAPATRISLYASACRLDLVLISNSAAAPPPAGGDTSEVEANVATLAACQAHPRLAALYWVRPGQLDSNVHAFTGALRTEPFLGAAFAPAEGGFDAADRLLDPYVAAVGAAGKPVFFCVSSDARATPGKIHELARRHPKVSIVLCLCGAAEAPRAAALDVVAYALRQQNADLYIDTSHAGAAEIATAVGAVGAERVLFGTDALRRGDAHVPRHITLLDELRSALPAAQLDLVVGGNAARLLRLPTAAA